jgi:hypothetical protein
VFRVIVLFDRTVPSNPSVEAVGPRPACVAGLLQQQSDAEDGATEAGGNASTKT